MKDDLHQGQVLTLAAEQVHYLKTVLRRPDGAALRLFNGRDGEWQGTIAYSGKKDGSVALQQQIRPPVQRPLRLHLVFALIKKDRLDFMIEKSVELGVTDFHPVLTQNTVVRDLNAPRMEKQILEAAEQCERLDLPTLHPLVTLKDLPKTWPRDISLYAALEREDLGFIGALASVPAQAGLLIGPEGGWSDAERDNLTQWSAIQGVSLGEQILRSETAALFGLSVLQGLFTR